VRLFMFFAYHAGKAEENKKHVINNVVFGCCWRGEGYQDSRVSTDIRGTNENHTP
jgi:hypothetical protein